MGEQVSKFVSQTNLSQTRYIFCIGTVDNYLAFVRKLITLVQNLLHSHAA